MISRNTFFLSHIQEEKADGTTPLISVDNGMMQYILAAPALKPFCLREINKKSKVTQITPPHTRYISIHIWIYIYIYIYISYIYIFIFKYIYTYLVALSCFQLWEKCVDFEDRLAFSHSNFSHLWFSWSFYLTYSNILGHTKRLWWSVPQNF